MHLACGITACVGFTRGGSEGWRRLLNQALDPCSRGLHGHAALCLDDVRSCAFQLDCEGHLASRNLERQLGH
jgi:hypothetical protein